MLPAQAELPLLAAGADPIKPTRVYGELRRRLERDAVVICDGGDFASYAGKYVEVFEPGCWLDTGPYGCLGNGMGYAIAARVARPDAQVVALLGDGAAGFSLMDADSLVRHGLPVVMVVGNNGMWGLEKHPMQAIYGWDVACDLQPGCRYDEVVRALGGAGETVTDPDDVGPALDRAFASGVALPRQRRDRPRRRLSPLLEPRLTASEVFASPEGFRPGGRSGNPRLITSAISSQASAQRVGFQHAERNAERDDVEREQPDVVGAGGEDRRVLVDRLEAADRRRHQRGDLIDRGGELDARLMAVRRGRDRVLDEGDRIRRIDDLDPVSGRLHVAHPVDAERAPRGTVTVPRDEVPPARRRHDPVADRACAPTPVPRCRGTAPAAARRRGRRG